MLDITVYSSKDSFDEVLRDYIGPEATSNMGIFIAGPNKKEIIYHWSPKGIFYDLNPTDQGINGAPGFTNVFIDRIYDDLQDSLVHRVVSRDLSTVDGSRYYTLVVVVPTSMGSGVLNDVLNIIEFRFYEKIYNVIIDSSESEYRYDNARPNDLRIVLQEYHNAGVDFDLDDRTVNGLPDYITEYA